MKIPDYSQTLEAISFAARKHVGQVRKDGTTPYIAHPVRVVTILVTVFRIEDPVILAAAALHDTIEDTRTDWDELKVEFGEQVADIVATLSKDKRLEESQREAEYYKGLVEGSVEVKLCKLADLYDNLTDAATLHSDQRVKVLEKAEYAFELFSPGFPKEYQFALDRFKERILGARGSLGPR